MHFSLFTARRHVEEGEYLKALANYLVVLKSADSDVSTRCFDEFLSCAGNISGRFIIQHNLVDPLLSLYPRNGQLLLLIAQKLCENGSFYTASPLFSRIRNCNPSSDEMVVARIYEANIGTHLFDSWHVAMINDKYRNFLFAEAIRLCTSVTDVVLEIGSGTGLLSIIASRTAGRVIALEESSSLCDISKAIIRSNTANSDVSSKCDVIVHNIHSKQYIPEGECKPTVVVAEIMDCCAFGEGMLETFHDAHTRLVNTGAVFIPSKVSVYLTMIESSSIYALHGFERYRSKYVNIGYEGAEEPYWCAHLADYPDVQRLSQPIPVVGVNLQDVSDIQRYLRGVCDSISVPICKDGTLHCLAVHFRAELCDGVVLDSSSPECSCWEYGIFPLADPLLVNKGDNIPLTWSLQGSRLDVHYEEGLGVFDRVGVTDRLVRMTDDDIILCNDLTFSQEVISSLPPSPTRIALTRPMSFTIPYLRSGQYVLDDVAATELEDDSLYLKVMTRRNVDTQNGAEGALFDCIVWWPIGPDGSLTEDDVMVTMPAIYGEWRRRNAMRMEDEHGGIMPQTPTCFPDVLSCRAQLISSDRLISLCRPDPSAHFGIDLESHLHNWSLFEYRDIDLDTFEHQMSSEEFLLHEFNFQDDLEKSVRGDHTPHYHQYTEVIETCSTISGRIDGVVYWWTVGTYSTRFNRCASFVFKKPIQAREGERIRLRFDLYKGQMLVTVED